MVVCQNPDIPCANVARYYWQGRKLCRMCCLRFKRHGDGKKLRPWGKVNAKSAKGKPNA